MFSLSFYDLNSKQRNTVTLNRGRNNNVDAADVDTTSSSSSNSNSNNNNRLSWPQFCQRARGNNQHPNNTNSKICEEDAMRPSSTGKFNRVLCPDEARVMQKANQIVMYVPLYLLLLLWWWW